MSEFVVLLERLIGWAELWGMGTDSHSAEKLADTRAAMVEYVTGLEEEVERLREEIDAIGKARHKDVVTLGGLYLENKSLKAENARLREAARWIPVEERLPENNNAVLVTDGGHSIVEGSYVLGRWVAFSEGRYIHPTHWRALPEPPEVE